MRRILGVVAAALLVWLGAAGAGGQGQQVTAQQPAGTGRLVVVSWGGSYMEAQRKAFFEPFQRRYGIQVVEDTGPQIERSRAEVQSGRPSYDLTATNQAFYMIGVDQNLWEPIDYKYFDPADLKAMPARRRFSVYLVPVIMYRTSS